MSLPNETGGGGIGFGTNENSTGGDGGGSSSGGDDSGDVVLRSVVIAAVCIGALIGLVLLVYLLAVVMDRFLCCCPFFIPVGDHSSEFDTGPVAHKAGLWGLTLKERRLILDRLLKGTPYSKDLVTHKSVVASKATEAQQDGSNDDGNPVEHQEASSDSTSIKEEDKQIKESEKNHIAIVPTAETESTSDSVEQDIELASEAEAEEEAPSSEEEAKKEEEEEENDKAIVPTTEIESTSKPVEEDSELASRAEVVGEASDVETADGDTESVDECPVDEEGKEEATAEDSTEAAIMENAENFEEAEHLTTCAICINEYAEGEMILRGRLCDHMFHFDCAMEWLDRHDHCPFCRKLMMKPSEFRETAIEVLGEKRIKQLTSISRRHEASRTRQNTMANENLGDNNNEATNDADDAAPLDATSEVDLESQTTGQPDA